MVGVPCHFRPTNARASACGVVNPRIAAYDGREVNCLRCRRTKRWKVYMGIYRATPGIETPVRRGS